MADPYNNNVTSLIPFDDPIASAVYFDSAGRNWTINGSPQISPTGVFNTSMLFNGTTDYLYAASDLGFNFGTSDFTIECWIQRTTTNAQWPTIVASNSQYGSGYFFMVERNTNHLVFAGGAFSNPFLTSTNLIPVDGIFRHVSVTRQGNTFRLFIDGNLEATATTTVAMNFSNGGTLIGANGWDGTNGFFAGYIDEFRVTNGVARYTAPFTVPTAAFDFTLVGGGSGQVASIGVEMLNSSDAQAQVGSIGVEVLNNTIPMEADVANVTAEVLYVPQPNTAQVASLTIEVLHSIEARRPRRKDDFIPD